MLTLGITLFVSLLAVDLVSFLVRSAYRNWIVAPREEVRHSSGMEQLRRQYDVTR